VTHDPVEATTLADRLVLLEGGRITDVGTPDEIRTRPRTRYGADLVGVNAFQGPLDRLEDGSGAIVTDGGRIVVAWPEWYERGDVIGVLRPPDVTLSIERPTGSARNVLRGVVRSVVIDGQRARVRLASSPELIAEVTAGSVERLGLRDGVETWASFKAVEVDVHPL
jgi:molybdate transport system ATP-binding protein